MFAIAHECHCFMTQIRENGLSLIDKIMLELEEPINESTHQYSLETISLKWSYPELLHSP